MADLEADADRKAAMAELAEQKAQADQNAVSQQMSVVDAADREAKATAVAGADTPREVGEVTQKYDALGREQTKLSHLEETSKHTSHTAQLAKKEANESLQQHADASQSE